MESRIIVTISGKNIVRGDKDMNEKQDKKITIGLVVCFVVVVAVIGMIVFNRPQTIEEEKQLVKNEDVQAKIELQVPMETPKVEEKILPPSEPQSSSVEPVIEERVFSSTDELLWPIAGNVLLNYSMDQTIYFSTLDQYKYNPAIIISGNVGDEVRAAETGKVISIEEDAKTGTTVRMDLGKGFEMLCGQLSAVRVKEGQTVNKGELLGYVAEPTKYYVVEGPNVYFQLLKDGEPVNPLEYMES